MLIRRAPARQWSAAEDRTLTEQVAIFGEDTERWKTIALALPGRTNKACRKRWKHSLHPSLRKSNWSAEEDSLLLELNAEHPGKWAYIASHIEGRTDDACAKRYREALDPALKKEDWTCQEDEKLLNSYARYGVQWAKVGEELGRSGLGCRNRWRLLERRRKALDNGRIPRGSAGAPRKRKRDPSQDHEDGDPSLPGPTYESFDSNPQLSAPPELPFISHLNSTTNWPNSPTPTPILEYSTSMSDVQPPEITPILTSIDPSVIGIALGKCQCGCTSGNTQCGCKSLIPTAQNQSDLLSHLDMESLFPYLQAELPDIFRGSSDGQVPRRPPSPRDAPQTSADDAVNTPNPAKSCCSGKQTSLSDVLPQKSNAPNLALTPPSPWSATPRGSLNSDSPNVIRLNGEQSTVSTLLQYSDTQSIPNSMLSVDSNAETVKMILDYASFLFQQQRTSPQSSSSTNHISPLTSLCQPPASQLLISLIEKYQQQKSASASVASSPSLAISSLASHCECGCSNSESQTSKTASTSVIVETHNPSSLIDSRSSHPSIEAPTNPEISVTETVLRTTDEIADLPQIHNSGMSDLGSSAEAVASLKIPPKNCCSERRSSSSLATFSPNLLATPGKTLPSQLNSSAGEHLMNNIKLPSYIPGCECGCADNAAADSCTCGCVGVCRCHSFDSTVAMSEVPDNFASTASSSTFLDNDVSQSDPSEPWSVPSVIPGCGCGCSDEVAEGNCACGCEGVCRCGLGAKLRVEYGTWDLNVLEPFLRLPSTTDSGLSPSIEFFHHDNADSHLPTHMIQPAKPSLDYNTHATLHNTEHTAQIPRDCPSNPDSQLHIHNHIPQAQQDVASLLSSLLVATNLPAPVGYNSGTYQPPSLSQDCPPLSTAMDYVMENTFPTTQNSFHHSTPNGVDQMNGRMDTSPPFHHNPLNSDSSGQRTSSESRSPPPGGRSREKVSQSRLSGLLMAPIDAYACGHPNCWKVSSDPEASDSTKSPVEDCAQLRFCTSSALVEHRRKEHGEEDDNFPPGKGTGVGAAWLYRCALRGCGKGWKSINGIQYHLQLSKAHFESAMNERTAASRRTGLRPVRNSRWQSSSVDLVQEGFDSEPMSVISANRRRRSTSISSVFLEPALRRDKHACPHAGCPNVYKQLSGLKYHLVHGHSSARPFQLQHVPPALARKMEDSKGSL